MEGTGIIRNIDDLGRVVIPIEIRKRVNINEGDQLEVFTCNGGKLVLKKHSPISVHSNLARKYAEVLSSATGRPVIISDRDSVVTHVGTACKNMTNREISVEFRLFLCKRMSFARVNDEILRPVDGIDCMALAGAPIISNGDLYGSVVLLTTNTEDIAQESEIKLVGIAAAFFASLIEE